MMMNMKLRPRLLTLLLLSTVFACAADDPAAKPAPAPAPVPAPEQKAETRKEEKKAGEQAKKEEPEKSAAEKAGIARLEECRKLWNSGDQNGAVKKATESLEVFAAAFPARKWVNVGTIELDAVNVEIHINMTEEELAKEKDLIVTPYTFCIFAKGEGEKRKLHYVLDYEQGWDKGKLESAAIGRYSGSTHINYGMVDNDATFTAIRDKALKLIKEGNIGADKADK